MSSTHVFDSRWGENPPVFEEVPLNWLKVAKRNARDHSAGQIDEIKASFRASGSVNPIIVHDDYRIIAGHGRFEALKQLRASTAPVLRIRHLTEAQARAYAIADNRLAEKSTWDETALALELRELQLTDPSLDLCVTGFAHSKIDQLIVAQDQSSWSDLDDMPNAESREDPTTREGDLWLFGEDHRLICGDSTDRAILWRLLGKDQVRQVVTDPPFNRPSKSYSGKGRHQHENFRMGAGEMSTTQFTDFLAASLAAAGSHLIDGALLHVFMDWQHISELLQAGAKEGLELKNLLVWDKGKSGMGSLYRSAHELVGVFKSGTAPHLNNIMLGKNGRDRSNILRYAGMNRFGSGRDRALAMHATVKPVQLIADLLLDASLRGDIIFDGFAGSGTTLIAAKKTERKARVVELEPRYCDTIVERFIRAFDIEPILADCGRTFSKVRAARRAVPGTGDARHGE